LFTPGKKEGEMEQTYIDANKKERERLRKLVKGMTDEELKLVIYQEGWTVAAALAHLAFGDRRRLVLMQKWEKQGVSPSPMDDNLVDIINDSLLPFFLELPPRAAANMAIISAEKIDGKIEKLKLESIDAITSLGDRHALNRSLHRKMHLDEIEILLKKNRDKKH
jgi:Mycothiol maleylpyruvate isomerase N-terminal domain